MLRFISSLVVVGTLGLISVACGKNPTAPSTVAAAPTQPGPTVARAVTLEGPIDSITSPNRIVVKGQQVMMRDDVSIMSEDVRVSFSKLRVGARVNVTGEQTGDGPIMASLVKVLDPIPESINYR